MHIKLDELIRAMDQAQNALLNLEELEEKDLERIRADYLRLAEHARMRITRRRRAAGYKPYVKNMRHSSKNLREFCVRTLILGLFVVQGCSTLSRDQQPQVPPFDSQAGAVTTPGSDRSAKIEPRKDDKGGSSATVQPAHIGEASWYGPGFQGKKTASGEIFDDSKLTAAHKTIPLGSKAKVTNLTNGKTVEVKINDRGPFIDGRMVDLSQAAAKALGMIDRGTARVQIDLLPDIPRAVRKCTNHDHRRIVAALKIGVAAMQFYIALQPLVALIAGILILMIPRLLNYIVALYLIITGILGLIRV